MAGARPHRLVAGHGRGRRGQCMVGAALPMRACVPEARRRFQREQQEQQRQRGGDVCGRELPGISRARSFSRARSLWRDEPQVPFQNGATRGAGTRGCNLPLIHGTRRQLASTEAPRRPGATLRRDPSRNRSRGTRRSGSPGRTAPPRRWAAQSANADAAHARVKRPSDTATAARARAAAARARVNGASAAATAARARVNGARAARARLSER